MTKPSFQSRQKQPPLPDDDQSFDDRALHLQQNIYGSDKGKLRLLILQRDLAPIIDNVPALSVLDVGCGMGLMSEWVAQHGHRVLACDNAAVMIETAEKRLSAYAKTHVVQTTLQDLPSRCFDVVMCHAVLEWVAEQADFLDKLTTHVGVGGYLSLMFYNAWAREMAQLVYGNFDYIDKNYEVRQRVKLNPHRPCFPDEIEKMLLQRGFSIVARSGIRVFYDIMRNREHYQALQSDITRHELRISSQSPYWQMGRYVHFLLKKQVE